VLKAQDEKFYRANKIEEIQRARILEGTVFIDTQEKVVGQVNALTISDPGDYAFGLPARITARTYVGHGGVGHLDRDTGMAGQIHNKGLLTLSSYFSATYAAQRSISFSGQLTFEQNYGTIEGDSASTAELCALLSSLSGYPIKQALAITGSVNQKGDVQPIGAVNEKIEGFFEVCAARGLTGDQGVIIPKSNVQDLMLNEKVLAAVQAGQFRIWAVGTVDEAIELVTGVKAGKPKDGRWPDKTIHHAVQKRLRELAKGHDRDGDDDDDRRKPSRRPKKKKPVAKRRLPIKKIPSKKKPYRSKKRT
jgi:predicted ATP-dependent protease